MTNYPTKAEILITRACNLKCDYCAMKKYSRPTLDKMSDSDWEKVPEKLSQLNIPFAPIYGAEPLLRKVAVAKFVRECRARNIETSVITNATMLDIKTIRLLKNAGLRSITMSYDGILGSNRRDVKTKSDKAFSLVEILPTFFRDVEIVFTLTKDNLDQIIPTVYILSSFGVWSYIEILHPDRRQPGSKCTNTLNKQLLQPSDKQEVIKILKNLLKAKVNKNIRLHNSVKQLKYFIKNYNKAISFKWKCTPGAWITIDQDGYVFGCDDYQPEDMRKFHILSLNEDWTWDDFVTAWTKALKNCPGCFWGTHYMASDWYNNKPKNWIKEMTHK